MALRALSSGPTTAINSGTILDQFLGPHGKDIELGTADPRSRFLRSPRIWFSRSRLILTSNARLASSALTVREIEGIGAVRIGLETGPTATWLWTELKQLGLPVIRIDARQPSGTQDADQ
jgi:hypothetical protein